MKAAKEWKSLTQTQRRAWSAWAKNNPMMLDDGNLRRVSGRKAMTMVLRNRAIADEGANPTVVPEPVTWLSGVLSLRDAGPFTVNNGFIGFRLESTIEDATKWFVWASAPLPASEADPHRKLRFVQCLAVPALFADDLTPDVGPAYTQVWGSWDGPGEDGEWLVPTFMWFRLHQYANGQLGPSVVLKGQIQLEL
jgi:hypothetical protein